MKEALRAVIIFALGLAMVFGAVGSIRWAKRGGASSRLMASALLLGLGMGVVVKPPQQGVEQAEEEREEVGGESGDPPAA